MEVKPSKAMRLFFDFNNHIMMTDDDTQERLNVFIIIMFSLHLTGSNKQLRSGNSRCSARSESLELKSIKSRLKGIKSSCQTC